jgi:Ca2+-binding EF-hand superfamily protein
MSSISSSYSVAASAANTMQARHRPDTAKMAETLFSKLDSTGKGYVAESDLASALSALTGSSSSTSASASASQIFSELDGDGDGKVTQDEMKSGLAKLAEALDSQFNASRMQGGGAMPPPPPPADDAGFTKDQLSSQLSEIGSSDPARASLISKVVENFDAADTDGDGKVSFSEAMAYEQSTSSNSTSTTSSTGKTSDSASSSSTQASDALVFRQIMELLRAYGSQSESVTTSSGSLVSALA